MFRKFSPFLLSTFSIYKQKANDSTQTCQRDLVCQVRSGKLESNWMQLQEFGAISGGAFALFGKHVCMQISHNGYLAHFCTEVYCRNLHSVQCEVHSYTFAHRYCNMWALSNILSILGNQRPLDASSVVRVRPFL